MCAEVPHPSSYPTTTAAAVTFGIYVTLFVNRPKRLIGMSIVAVAAMVVGYEDGCGTSAHTQLPVLSDYTTEMMLITFTLYSKSNMLYRLIISDLILFINFFLVDIIQI